jgi:acetylornithine deacetylase/succinyl-diaminopimelate desuccinylase-like protein
MRRVEEFLAQKLGGRGQSWQAQPDAQVEVHRVMLAAIRTVCRSSLMKLLSGGALACCLVLAPTLAPAATAGEPLAQIRAFRAAHERMILHELAQLLAIPNVTSDRSNIRRNAEAIALILQRQGLKPQLLEPAGVPDVPPLVYAQWKVPRAKRTLVLYAHYDGQPVNPAEWVRPPFTPTLRTGPANEGGTVVALDSPKATQDPMRLYARGAGDDKAGVMVILSALDALRVLHREPTDNLIIAFEGEEEAGSPHLGQILRDHRALFHAQLWVICDGPVHPSGRVEITYGARGDMNADLTVYGAIRPLHSGHYGNWAPNPALRLARLLASMKDDRGRVTIPAWYDGIAPLGDRERRALTAAAQYDGTIRRELGLAATESDWSLPQAVMLPSLNINGMRAANVGAEAANVIPATATAVLDMRLVVGNDPHKQFEKLREYVRSRGYYVIDHEPTPQERLAHPLIATLKMRPGIYAAARMPMSDPFALAVAAGVRAAASPPPLEMPSSGGSLPLSVIKEALGTPSMVVSIANYDDNQHAANENLRLGNLWNGIDIYAALLLHP